jgi:hypothetical protein
MSGRRGLSPLCGVTRRACLVWRAGAVRGDCPGTMRKPRSQTFSIRPCRPCCAVDNAAEKKHSRMSLEYRGAQRPDPAGSCDVRRSARALTPRICRQTAHRPAPQRGRAPAPAVCGRRRSRPTPCAQPSTAAPGRGAQRTRLWSRTANAVLPSGQNYAESPQLRLALALRDGSSAMQGGVGARGRAARPTNAGGNCEHLQDVAGAE